MERYPFGFWESEESKKAWQAQIYSIGNKVMSFFLDEGDFKHGFEQREGQQDMSFEILDAIKNGQHIAVEAGVGIGKSFAYLAPLLLYNQKTGKPVVVATSTIALQEQLLGDVKRLETLLGVYPEVILAKGQTHYICPKRADEYLSRPQAEMCEEISNAVKCGYHDRKSIQCTIPTSIWNSINIQRFGKKACRGCSYTCAYRNMRNSLKCASGIILCNQDFLTSHLMATYSGMERLITNRVEIVVIDEAHNLEEKVRSATTNYYSKNELCGRINYALNAVSPGQRGHVEKSVKKATTAVQTFFKLLDTQINNQIEVSEHDMKYAERFFFKTDTDSLKLLQNMITSFSDAAESIDIFTSFDDRDWKSHSSSDDLMELSLSLSELGEDFDQKLIWIEKHGREVKLVCCPKNTRDIIRTRFFNSSVNMVLTSATLTHFAGASHKERYAYFIANTGFPCEDKGVLAEPKPSPYSYDSHAMIYCCDDLPHPAKARESFLIEGADRLIEILKISRGKALVLFTAKTDMEEVYRILKQKELPFKILMQQQGASQDKILTEFREDVDSVLLGTGTYWEGISIEGKSLSNLIIFRLPFPVPDPIIEYKCSIAKNPLMEVQVPEMITKLKQGIGRLIRNYSDTGIVSIIDPRLSDTNPTPYQSVTWASLPIKNRTNDINELASFYRQVQQCE